MSAGGTNRTVYSEQTMKGASVESVMKSLTNANEEAKKADPKNAKKQKKSPKK